MSNIIIDEIEIGNGCVPYLIAEVGINHNGSVDECIKLIRSAKNCGANAVKLQAFIPEEFLTRNSKYFDTFSLLSFDENQYETLFKEAALSDITIFSSVFDNKSLEIMEKLNCPAYKVASGDIDHLPLLKNFAKTGKPIIISTGGATLDDCKNALSCIREENPNSEVALLHCVSNYPLEVRDANLSVIETLKNEFKVPVGFSDHSIGEILPIAATSLGADIIEKHFTLNTSADGLDHSLSADPLTLRKISEGILIAYLSRGTGKKLPVEEMSQIEGIRRGIVAKQKIEKGAKINAKMLAFKRPQTGILPKDVTRVIGMTAEREIQPDDPIFWNDLK